ANCSFNHNISTIYAVFPVGIIFFFAFNLFYTCTSSYFGEPVGIDVYGTVLFWIISNYVLEHCPAIAATIVFFGDIHFMDHDTTWLIQFPFVHCGYGHESLFFSL
ncbi:hypothetical protein ACJX0J_016360, partial [Zea mays]